MADLPPEVAQLLVRWRQSPGIDPVELCKDCPELLPALQDWIARANPDTQAIAEILGAWRATGGKRTPAELCADRPELLPEVQRQIAAAQRGAAPSARLEPSPDVEAPVSGVQPSAERTLTFDGQIAANPFQARLPQAIGRYRITRLIGEGGMGAVYEAVQESPHRLVAVKVIRPGLLSAKMLRRFQIEANALGRLQDPGIAQIFEAGLAETAFGSQPYFAMELVNGLPVNEFAARRKLSLRSRLKIIARIAEAVHHAHQKGIVHRDLKPGNIMVTAAGQPKILDFGLAKNTDSDVHATLQTEIGVVMGTLPYMAPEQTLGNSDEIDTRTDIYAIGVMGYELLAGRRPLDLAGKSLPEALRMIRDDDPSSLAMASRALSGDVETIISKAMSKEKAQRYESAHGLAADIKRYLGDEPITARPSSTWYQSQKFAKRHRALVLGLAGVFAALALGVGGTTYGLLGQRARATEAEQARDEATRQKDLARQAQTGEKDALDEATRERDAAATASEEAKKQRDAAQSALAEVLSARSAETIAREAAGKAQAGEQDALSEALRLKGVAETAATQLAKERDATRDALRAANERLIVSLGYESGMHLAQNQPAEARRALYQGKDILAQTSLSPLWIAAPLFAVDERFSRPLSSETSYAGASNVTSVAFSPVGREVLTGDIGGLLRLWDSSTGKAIRVFTGHSRSVESVAFLPDGRTALSGSEDKTLKLWDITSGKELRTFLGHTDAVRSVAIARDGQTAISGSDDKTIKVWNIATGREIRTLAGHGGPIRSVALAPDGHTALAGSRDASLKLWDLATGKELHAFPGNGGSVECVAISPDGAMGLSGGYALTARLWDLATGKELRTLKGHAGAVECAAFSSDGHTALTGSDDTTLKLWDLATGNEIRTYAGSAGAVRSVTFARNGRIALSGGINLAGGSSALKLWDLGANTETRPLAAGPTSTIWCLAIGPDGRTALSGSDDKTVQLWDLATGKELRTLKGHTGRVERVAFSPDGRRCLSGSDDKTLRLWDLNTGKELHVFTGHTGSIKSLAFSPDGGTALSGSDDKTLKLWDLVTGKEIHTFAGHGAGVARVWFLSGGRTALSCDLDGTVKSWDIATGKEIHTLAGRSGVRTYLVVFAPDGQAALTENFHGLRLWDLTTGREIRTFTGHSSGISDAAFSPDGRTVVSGSPDKTLKLWDVASGQEIHSFAGFAEGVTSVAFSPDGLKVLAASALPGATLKLWDFTRGEQHAQFEALLPAADAARAKNPEDPAALSTWGRYYAFRGMDDWAVDHLERSRKAGGIVSPLLLGQCYWRLNRRPEALAELQKALLQKEAPDFYLRLCIDALQTAVVERP